MKDKLLIQVNIAALPVAVKKYYTSIQPMLLFKENVYYFQSAIADFLSDSKGYVQIRDKDFPRSHIILNEEMLHKKYTEGFIAGQKDLDHTIQNPSLFAGKEDKLLRNVFSIVYKREGEFTNFPFTLRNGERIIEEPGIVSYAHAVGEYCRGWQYILDNPDSFEKLFHDNEEEPMMSIQSLQFHGNATELAELTKALIAAGHIQGKEVDIFKSISTFFNVEIKNPHQTISKIKNRNIGSETLYLDKLKQSLLQHQNKENKGK